MVRSLVPHSTLPTSIAIDSQSSRNHSRTLFLPLPLLYPVVPDDGLLLLPIRRYAVTDMLHVNGAELLSPPSRPRSLVLRSVEHPASTR